jgi:predicted acetyltransferase
VVDVDGEVGAVAVAIPATWWYHGVGYPVSAIAGVATRAVDRRRGLASRLVRGLLQAEQAGERCVSLLYPFRHGYYRRLGYATVGLTHFYRLPTAQLPDDPELRRAVRPLREPDRQAIQALYRRSLTGGPGGLERNAGQWAQRWGRQDERWVAYDEEGLQGYLAYRPDGQQLEVRELVALSARAERGLWAFLAAQADQRHSITYHAPTERPLWATLAEPPMVEAANRGFVLTDTAALTVGLMVRLVDVAEALRRRRCDPELAGSWSMEVTDPVLDGAPRVLSVTLEGGRARVEEAGGARPVVECDVVTLSQLFCGVVRASDARWYGRLRADDDTLPLLDRAFTGPVPFVHPADWF